MRWFKKKVEIQFRGENGVLRKRKIPEDAFNKLIEEGKRKGVIEVHEACRVHIADPMQNELERIENWIIGEQIPRDVYDRFRDRNGDLYMMVHYEKGERISNLVSKQIWDQLQSQLRSL